MPKSKPHRKASSNDSDSDSSGPDDITPIKKSKPSDSKKPSGDSEELSWDLGKFKFVKLSEFKGKWYVNIREYYMDKDSEMKPSKKGVMLTMEQWEKFKNVFDDVNDAVKKHV